MKSCSRFSEVAALITVFATAFLMQARAADDVTLSGREAAALRLTVDDFIRHHYSTSGDLTHYKLKLPRTSKQLEIDFIPDTDARGPYPGGGTDYGQEVVYTVALDPIKIVSSLFTQ